MGMSKDEFKKQMMKDMAKVKRKHAMDYLGYVSDGKNFGKRQRKIKGRYHRNSMIEY